MGLLKRIKENKRKWKENINKMNKLGTVVWEGTLKNMPKREKLRYKGCKLVNFKARDIFGKTGIVVLKLKRKK